MQMTIGRVADAAGVSIDTLRFYERQGLVARPSRAVSGYRQYSAEVLDRLRFIRDAKALGFSLREIKELLAVGVKSTRECGPVTRKAEAKLVAMNDEIERLKRMRRTLTRMIEDCGGVCVCAKCSSNRNGHGASRAALNHPASSKRNVAWTS
jgi:MerR family transcriptional regulator, copper efflux regulator